jgi:copper chaperone CopZ
METVKFIIPNISCGHCVNTIKAELGDILGVQSVEGDPATKEITVTFSSPASTEKILDILKEINYPPA